MLRFGAEINTVDKSGRSALMVAADKGHSGTVGGSWTGVGCLLCAGDTSKSVLLCISVAAFPSPLELRQNLTIAIEKMVMETPKL